MEELEKQSDVDTTPVPDSPKPLAFTIDFGEGKVDKQRHKLLMEKYQKRQLSVTEKKEKQKSKGSTTGKTRDDLSLPLKNVTTDRMTQSCKFPSVSSPEIELRDSEIVVSTKLVRYANLECDNKSLEKDLFVDGTDFDFEADFDKSDNISDAGTYTLDADNYSEEQKERMSIDREFQIEQVSLLRKTEDYIKSLDIGKPVEPELTLPKPQTLDLSNSQKSNRLIEQKQRLLSPILSPTQNLSITQNNKQEVKVNNEDQSKTFTKIMFPSPKAKTGIGSEQPPDHGSVISVTSSGAFRSRNEKKRHVRHLSLSKSGVQVEAYTENGFQNEIIMAPIPNSSTLTASVVHVTDNFPKPPEVRRSSFELGIVGNKLTNIPFVLGCGGKISPTKIPSPIHTSRPRSRNSTGSTNIDLSDSSLETESYLKPTQNIINSLQQRLSLDNDQDLDATYLNNDARNLLKKPTHLRHNSFDDKNLKFSNKLEHFQTKNFQGIDQTYTNVLNQYKVNKIQNSPNNSPIRRSSSFSTNKNQINLKNFSKETNLINSPNINRNTSSIQRSSSTANIKPNLLTRRPSTGSDHHQKIDRTIYGDTESSSEEDYDKNIKKKDITNTRYNRAFSLRRARLEEPPPPKCPNTPEMRRKFPASESSQRAISVDRKPTTKTNDVPSRYLQSVSKKNSMPPPPSVKPETPKSANRAGSAGKVPQQTGKSQVFSRTDSGRYSMRSNSKPPAGSNTPKNLRKDSAGKSKSGGRSNSSLSSREVEFQNWKRRKSYDPMKAAAEGKRKAELAKKQSNMTASYTEGNQDYDSSPSHSSSVHRSQSFHGTAALEQLISSDEEDQTLSADEGFSPPTPSPCELSPARASLKYAWREQILME
ncbi:uncharacterized protein DDB_G0286591 [Onthophagus taurus]|uniref:uncharacterized protein DDB_G0286591 n=1 Tax=Onthophagus taurus TaxID=166361 RepID=UPI0039BDD617